MNQTDFGKQIGVTQSAVAGYESGAREPINPVISSICKEFHVNETWLRMGDGEMYEAAEDEIGSLVAELIDDKESELYKLIIKIMKGYQDLDPKSRKVVDDLIKRCMENN